MTDRIETPAFTGTPRAASPFGPVRKWPKPAAPKPLPAPRPPAAMSPADIAAHEAASYVRPTAHRDDVPGLPPLPRPDATRRPIAVGTIRHRAGRTIRIARTAAGTTGRIAPARIRATTDDLMAGGAA